MYFLPRNLARRNTLLQASTPQPQPQPTFNQSSTATQPASSTAPPHTRNIPAACASALLVDLQKQLGVDQTTLSIMGTEQPPPMLIPCPARANSSNSGNGLILHHWTRGGPASDSECSTNRFAAFSTRAKPDIVTYTTEEYNQVLVDDAWTKPDTDHLFDLCRQFDLRFPIIADHLKARYVDVTRRVLSRLRHPLADPPTKALLNSLHFDAEKERIRKSHVRTLQARSQADVDEEDRLHALLLDIEAHQILITRERSEVLSRFFKGYDPQYMADYNAQRSEYKEKMMVNGVASTLVTIDGILNYGEQAKLTPGVSVRSAGIRSLKPAVVARIGPIMQGMYKIRPSTLPIMCTSKLAAAFEETRSAIIHKLDLQKQVEKAEADLRGMRGGSVGSGYGAGSHLGKGMGKGSASGLAQHDKRSLVGSSPHPMGDGRDRKRARRN
ncbi:hypothetical protein BCR44DRAFT_1437756 [Catenaria anguillulae PL171]|uniref:SWR1-complex protein 4 n=1 Tax=Catenaria anguillulae PL171 TaxID=765915 RepID=A0A1Y2HG49_9FUNG|nr:hypothetical protein BCR44DRAFT_1437756 [Catenaria anguillulae PL171]